MSTQRPLAVKVLIIVMDVMRVDVKVQISSNVSWIENASMDVDDEGFNDCTSWCLWKTADEQRWLVAGGICDFGDEKKFVVDNAE